MNTKSALTSFKSCCQRFEILTYPSPLHYYGMFFFMLIVTKRIFKACLYMHQHLTGDVFSGVGPLAISAARIVKRVLANDLNPYAVEYLERNSVLNKLEKKIKV